MKLKASALLISAFFAISFPCGVAADFIVIEAGKATQHGESLRPLQILENLKDINIEEGKLVILINGNIKKYTPENPPDQEKLNSSKKSPGWARSLLLSLKWYWTLQENTVATESMSVRGASEPPRFLAMSNGENYLLKGFPSVRFEWEEDVRPYAFSLEGGGKIGDDVKERQLEQSFYVYDKPLPLGHYKTKLETPFQETAQGFSVVDHSRLPEAARKILQADNIPEPYRSQLAAIILGGEGNHGVWCFTALQFALKADDGKLVQYIKYGCPYQ